ncbi:hypothetical protein ACGH2B_11690 [Streptomyces sp. BBFR2]|uniref:hypothetical protein n=1 Tax=Streptomyces sp. BBFR2 TaxID=3372854 RepID=UPI0037D99D4C
MLAVLIAGIFVLIHFLLVDFRRDSPSLPGGYRSTIVSARKGLFEGSFRYTVLRKAAEGGIQSFRLTVEGARARRPAGAPSPGGTGDVRVGALMGARLRCAGSRIACTANSSERQPVLTPQDSAEWNWTIATPEAGKATVTLTLTAYYEGTREVLAETSPIEQDLDIEGEGNFWGGDR